MNPGSFYQLAIPHKDKIYLCYSIASSPEKLTHSSKMNTAAPEPGARVGQTSWKGRGVDMPPANPDISLKDPHIPYKRTWVLESVHLGTLQQVVLKSEPEISLSLRPLVIARVATCTSQLYAAVYSRDSCLPPSCNRPPKT